MKNMLVYKNVTVYDEDLTPVKIPYLAIKDGKISYMGENDPCPRVTPTECGGAFVIKPFCDYHYHLPGSRIYDLFGVNLTEISPDNYGEALSDAVKRLDSVRGYGWDVSSLAAYFSGKDESPLEFLDRISAQKPIYLFSTDFHSCWCNSAALALLSEEGIFSDFADSEVPSGASSILHEQIAVQIFNCERVCFSFDEIERAVLLEQEHLLSLGITQIFSLMFIGAPFFSVLEVLSRLDKKGLLKIKVHFSYTAYPGVPLSTVRDELKKCLSYESKNLSLASLKVYMDGVIDNHSAYLLENYSDISHKGEALWSDSQLSEMAACAAEYGLPLHVHAIGDGAAEQAARVLSGFGRAERGAHIIAHLQLCSKETMELMAKSGIAACLQPFWFYRGERALQLDRQRLGDRVKRMYPAASLQSKGIKLLFSSDCPATTHYDPMLALRLAVNSCDGEQISIADAYRAYCVGTYQGDSFVIKTGDKAELLILEGSLEHPEKARVKAVCLDGELIEKRAKTV